VIGKREKGRGKRKEEKTKTFLVAVAFHPDLIPPPSAYGVEGVWFVCGVFGVCV
jgi:hypothetical protein